ncbi:hypothetical protein EIMP300_77290 [Escherichia coli]|uniref:Uncharacterized protein n=1 Tax=Escherichia coli TaxID=562 RepID=A0A8S0G0W7_ECOLX|nr:hypothetical protein EIMP300_77290 [Escherichia coli]
MSCVRLHLNGGPGTGASQDAPVSCNAGKANPVRFRPHEISLSSGGHNKPLQETPYGYNPHL